MGRAVVCDAARVTVPGALPGPCPVRLLPSAAVTAAVAFSPGAGALADAVRFCRPRDAVAVLPLAVVAVPSAVVLVCFRMIELGVRRTVGQVRYDGRVLLTVVPRGGRRPGARALAVAAAAGIAAVVALGAVVFFGLGALPARVQGPAAAVLTLAVVVPFLLRLPSRAAEKALRTHRDAYGASVVADLARARSAPPGAGAAATAAYLATPGRPPIVGLATQALWTRVYSPAGLSATALPAGRLQARGIRRRMVLVHG